MKRVIWNALSAPVLAALLATSANAGVVSLRSGDGTIDLTGELLSYTDASFVVRTSIGQMEIDRNNVTCKGEGCPPPPEAPVATMVIRGSDTVGEDLMPLLVEGYANRLQAAVSDRNPAGDEAVDLMLREEFGSGDELMKVALEYKGSSTGLKALIEGETQVAMSSRPARGSEIRAIAEQGRGNLTDLEQDYIIAVDSILPIVSAQNPLDELSVGQLADLFSGRVANWAEIGGPDLPVTVYSRNTASGTFGVFEDQVLKPAQTSLSGDAVILDTHEQISDAVADDPGGIGYVGFAYVREAKPLSLIAACGVRMNSSVFAAKTEEYPLNRRLRLYVDNSELPRDVQGLLDYAVSADAEPLVRKAGFIDLGVSIDDSGLETERLTQAARDAQDPIALSMLRNMMIDLTGAQRLSTTFRFAPGSSQLDNKARRDLDRIVRFLGRPENAGKEAVFVGFTDGDGAFSANAVLSEQRAGTVLAMVRNHPDAGGLASVRMRATGYGELSPVGCNDDFKGRQRNRRVEVWIR